MSDVINEMTAELRESIRQQAENHRMAQDANIRCTAPDTSCYLCRPDRLCWLLVPDDMQGSPCAYQDPQRTPQRSRRRRPVEEEMKTDTVNKTALNVIINAQQITHEGCTAYAVGFADFDALCEALDVCPQCRGTRHAGIGAGCSVCHNTGHYPDQLELYRWTMGIIVGQRRTE